MTHQCSASCTAGWGTSQRSHCRRCGNDFTTVGNFDKHLLRGPNIVQCGNPAANGLVLNKRGVWQSPGEVDLRERFEKSKEA